MNPSAPMAKCPQCKRIIEWSSENPFRPFCSERCKLIDLGKWANEEYRVEQKSDPFDSEHDHYQA